MNSLKTIKPTYYTSWDISLSNGMMTHILFAIRVSIAPSNIKCIVSMWRSNISVLRRMLLSISRNSGDAQLNDDKKLDTNKEINEASHRT